MQSVLKVQAASPGWRDKLRKIDRLFLAVVVVPSLLSAIYFGLVASDVFVSESRFVVRSAERQANPGIGALLKGAPFASSLDDTHTVHDFMRSRDALNGIDSVLPLAKVFSASSIDALSRFDGLGLDHSREALFRYYQNRVSIELDGASGISYLKVNAFNANDAYQINALLLELGEGLVNKLNERARSDLVKTAGLEVEAAELRVKAAGAALAAYRNKKGVFDPERQSALQLQLVSKLQDELIAARTQRDQLRSLTPENPQLPGLNRRVKSLQDELDGQMSVVAGGNQSLSLASAEYERLALERTFAEKQLGVAMVSLEQARNEAQRKQLYLERIVQPHKPDSPLLPRRARNIGAIFLMGLVVWGILSMLIAGVREHED
jgi:capsular polysaccharide transport system permease protein